MEEEAIVEAKPEPAVEPVPVAAPTSAEAAEEDDDVDAFDFFTAEPIGSAARDLEKQQEATQVVAEEPMEEEAIVEAKPEPAVEPVPVAEKAPTSAEAAEEDDDVD